MLITLYDLNFILNPVKWVQIVIYYHVNIMDNDFKLARQGLNEFVHPGHKGLKFPVFFSVRVVQSCLNSLTSVFF